MQLACGGTLFVDSESPAKKPRMVQTKLVTTRTTIRGSRLEHGLYSVPVESISELQLKRHSQALTWQPKAHMVGAELDPVVAAWVEKGGFIVPRAYGLEHFGIPEYCVGTESTISLRFHGHLDSQRDQPAAAAAALDGLRNPTQRGGVLVLPCGAGKTTVGLYVASCMGGRLLVLVHKEVLMEQWIQRVNQFLPGARVGRIQGSVADSGPEFDVVVGMLQSVHAHDYGTAIEGFGLLIVDEAHHVAAETFLHAMGKVGAHCVLGLTATPVRADGLTDILYAAVGPIVHRVERAPVQGALLRVSQLPCSPTVCEHMIRVRGGGESVVNLSRLVTDLARDSVRINALALVILELLEEDRYIIVLADRTSLLECLRDTLLATGHARLSADPFGGARVIVGKTKKQDRPTALRARIVLSTFSLAAEGLDEPRLDTLVLATPKGDVTQAVGRILRPHPDKCSPMVVDFHEAVESGVLHGLRRKRAGIFTRHGFT